MRFKLWLAEIFCFAFLMAEAPALAHEGHDEGPPAVVNSTSGEPRTVATSEDYEIVAVLKGIDLMVYVDRFSDNSPMMKGTLTVTIGTQEMRAGTVGDARAQCAGPAPRLTAFIYGSRDR